MAIENVGKFEEILRGNKDVEAKFKAATESFTGDLNDERAVFEYVIASLAEEAQLPFSYEEALEYAGFSSERDDVEIDAIAGGACVCYIIGGKEHDEPGTGGSWSCIEEDVGAGYCYYAGIGILAG